MEEEEDRVLWEEFFVNTSHNGKAKPALENLKHEFQAIAALLIEAGHSKIIREKDANTLTLELTTIRDQIKGTRLATQENIAAQHALKEQMETLSSKRRDNLTSESSNHEEIANISAEFDSLKNAIASGAGWTPEQEEQRHVLFREREFMSKKLENQTTQVNSLRNEITRIMNVIVEGEVSAERLAEEKQAIAMKITGLNRTSAGILSEQGGLTKSIADVQAAIHQAQADLASRSSIKKQADKALSGLDADLVSSKATMGEYLHEYEALLQTIQDMSVSLNRQKAQNKKTAEELAEKEKSLSFRQKDVETMRRENLKLQELRELALAKMAEMDVEKRELEERRETLSSKIDYTRDTLIRSVQKEIESASRKRAALKNDLGAATKDFYTEEDAVIAVNDMLSINRNTKKNLEFERFNLQHAIATLVQKTQQIDEEKSRLDADAEAINQKYYTELEELKLQELQVKELQTKIAEDTARLKQKQNLYEVVRSDRNLYSKQLVDLQNDIAALKTTFRQMNHTIDQQKEDIAARDKLIVNEHFLHHSVEKERELLKNQVSLFPASS